MYVPDRRDLPSIYQPFFTHFCEFTHKYELPTEIISHNLILTLSPCPIVDLLTYGEKETGSQPDITHPL